MSNELILSKNVKVYPNIPIHINKDLLISRNMEEPCEMSVGNIERCMLLGARVFEVLEDGTEVMLYNNNYKKDNSAQQESLKNKDKQTEVTDKKDAVVTPPANVNKTDSKQVDVADTKKETVVTPPANNQNEKQPNQDNKDKK